MGKMGPKKWRNLGEKERWALKIEGKEIPSLTTFGYMRWMFKNSKEKRKDGP